MKFSNFKKQHGAVLAFSLLMLLLLTIAGVSMIQHNKQQLEMSNSERVLTQEFATAEGYLNAAKNVINTYPAHIDTGLAAAPNAYGHRCIANNTIQDIGLAGTVTGVSSATILSVKCLNQAKKIQECSTYSGGVVTCHPDALDVNGIAESDAYGNHIPDNRVCTGNTVAQLATMFENTTANQATNICYQAYNPNPAVGTTEVFGKCPSEIYSIQIISTNTTNGSERQIISDHVVGCGD